MRRPLKFLVMALGVLSCESAPTAVRLTGEARPLVSDLVLAGFPRAGGALLVEAMPASPIHIKEAPNVVATEVSSQRGERETVYVGWSDGRRRVLIRVGVTSRAVTDDVEHLVRTWHGHQATEWESVTFVDHPGDPSTFALFWMENDTRQILRLLRGMSHVPLAEPYFEICGFGWCSFPSRGSVQVRTDAVVPGDQHFSLRDGDTLTVRYTQPDGSELRRRFTLSGLAFTPLP